MAAKDETKAKDKEGKKTETKEKDGLITAVYKANLHCLQCARDIKGPLLCTEGVQTVEIDREKGEIKAKGIFDPVKVQKRIEKLSKKKIELISPIVKVKDNIQTEKKVIKEPKQAISRTTSVKVPMHCDQCERDLKKKLLMQKGIHSVKTDMKAQVLTVDGTMEPEKLVSFLRRKVHKHAEIVTSKDAEKKEEKKEKIMEEKKEKEKIQEEKKEKEKEKIKEENKEKEKPIVGEGKSAESSAVKAVEISNKEEINVVEVKPKDGSTPYFIHYVYAPQVFSDENPNACTIS